MRSEIIKIHQKVGAITVYVTHDQTEAMTMADRIVVMKDGYIQQIGTPREVYNFPHNMFVAGFVGSPAMNFLKCKCDEKQLFINNGGDEEIVVKLPAARAKIVHDYREAKIRDLKEEIKKEKTELEHLKQKQQSLVKPKKKEVAALEEEIKMLENGLLNHQESLKEFESGIFTIVFGFRPEDAVFVDKKDANVKLKCEIYELLGRTSNIYSYIGHERVILCTNDENKIEQGKEFYIAFNFDKAHLFDVETTLRIR